MPISRTVFRRLIFLAPHSNANGFGHTCRCGCARVVPGRSLGAGVPLQDRDLCFRALPRYICYPRAPIRRARARRLRIPRRWHLLCWRPTVGLGVCSPGRLPLERNNPNEQASSSPRLAARAFDGFRVPPARARSELPRAVHGQLHASQRGGTLVDGMVDETSLHVIQTYLRKTAMAHLRAWATRQPGPTHIAEQEAHDGQLSS
jgi:hypothetical protein